MYQLSSMSNYNNKSNTYMSYFYCTEVTNYDMPYVKYYILMYQVLRMPKAQTNLYMYRNSTCLLILCKMDEMLYLLLNN